MAKKIVKKIENPEFRGGASKRRLHSLLGRIRLRIERITRCSYSVCPKNVVIFRDNSSLALNMFIWNSGVWDKKYRPLQYVNPWGLITTLVPSIGLQPPISGSIQKCPSVVWICVAGKKKKIIKYLIPFKFRLPLTLASRGGKNCRERILDP